MKEMKIDFTLKLIWLLWRCHLIYGNCQPACHKSEGTYKEWGGGVQRQNNAHKNFRLAILGLINLNCGSDVAPKTTR